MRFSPVPIWQSGGDKMASHVNKALQVASGDVYDDADDDAMEDSSSASELGCSGCGILIDRLLAM